MFLCIFLTLSWDECTYKACKNPTLVIHWQCSTIFFHYVAHLFHIFFYTLDHHVCSNSIALLHSPCNTILLLWINLLYHIHTHILHRQLNGQQCDQLLNRKEIFFLVVIVTKFTKNFVFMTHHHCTLKQ